MRSFSLVERDSKILQADQAAKHWSSADTLLQAAWSKAVQSTSRGTCPSSFGKPSQAYQSQSGSSAKGGIEEFEIRNVVLAPRGEESPKENAVVSSRTYGDLSPVECQNSEVLKKVNYPRLKAEACVVTHIENRRKPV